MDKAILRGVTVNQGVVTGKVTVLSNYSHINNMNEGDILVIPNSHPDYALGVMKAGGVICEEGGRLSHICIVALEMGIPCITQAKNAIELLRGKDMVMLDADEGIVYEI
jgi:pyruvate,water dikinase